jgi:hypothetical protein
VFWVHAGASILWGAIWGLFTRHVSALDFAVIPLWFAAFTTWETRKLRHSFAETLRAFALLFAVALALGYAAGFSVRAIVPISN